MTGDDQTSLKLAEFAAGWLTSAEEAEIAGHLESCTECAQWLDTYRLLEAGAHQEEHIASDRLALLAVDRGHLAQNERQELEAHLGVCPRCSDELDLTIGALAEKDLPEAAEPPTGDSLLGRVFRTFSSPIIVAASLVAITVSSVFLLRGLTSRPSDVLQERHGNSLLIEAKGELLLQDRGVRYGRDLTVRAGEAIALGEGFYVERGATLSLEVGSRSGAEEAPPGI